jgi:hypothetical protein
MLIYEAMLIILLCINLNNFRNYAACYILLSRGVLAEPFSPPIMSYTIKIQRSFVVDGASMKIKHHARDQNARATRGLR